MWLSGESGHGANKKSLWVCTAKSRYQSWYDLTCCQDVKLQQLMKLLSVQRFRDVPNEREYHAQRRIRTHISAILERASSYQFGLSRLCDQRTCHFAPLQLSTTHCTGSLGTISLVFTIRCTLRLHTQGRFAAIQCSPCPTSRSRHWRCFKQM